MRIRALPGAAVRWNGGAATAGGPDSRCERPHDGTPPPPPTRYLTDNEGRFAFRIHARGFTISANKPGYADGVTGACGQRVGTACQLADNQRTVT